MDEKMRRVKLLGGVIGVLGLIMAVVGLLYGAPIAMKGLDSAQAVYAEQGVTLSYNEDGQLLDHGTVEGAVEIMDMLVNEWKFDVNMANFDPNDPLVNTRDELMYQYAVITAHILHGEETVVLTDEDVPITFRGVEYTEAGEYEIAVLDYYAEFDRRNVIEGQLRNAWSDRGLALLGALAAGHANQAAGELALGTTVGIGGIGLMFALLGFGMVWVAGCEKKD